MSELIKGGFPIKSNYKKILLTEKVDWRNFMMKLERIEILKRWGVLLKKDK